MSTKDNNKNSKKDNLFDDFEESFFSTEIGTAVHKSTNKSDHDEDSSEDFGYAGEVDSTEMPLDDGTDATDIFQRDAYDELLNELDAQGSIDDILEEDSFDDSPDIELVSNRRSPAEKEAVSDPAVTEDLLQEFSDELGEPLVETEGAQEQNSPKKPLVEDELLDMGFGGLDFEVDPFREEESGEFLSTLRDVDTTFSEAPGSDLLEESEQPFSLSPKPSTVDANHQILDEKSNVKLRSESEYETSATSADTSLGADDTWDGVLDMPLSEETFDGWIDQSTVGYTPSGEQEHYQRLRDLFLKECKVTSSQINKQYLWAECARISANALREDDKALEFFRLTNEGENGVLRNADLKNYADVAARAGQTRLYLDVLQQWALEREGVLSAEAWGDIAIFLQKKFGNVETATDAIKRAIDSDPTDWLNWQFLCQIQESVGQWDELVKSFEHLEQLSSGPLSAQYAYQQALVYLHRLNDVELGLEKLKSVLEYGANVQAAMTLLKVGIRLDDSETILHACDHIWSQLDCNSDRLLWALKLYDWTHGAYGQDKLLASIDIHESIESFWLYLALLESSDVEERKRVLLEATEQERSDLALVWFHLSLLFEQEDDERAGEALLKTVELDPFAIIAVDDYVEHLIAKEAFEECVDWLCNLYELVLPEVPEVALAYLAQAAFIADAYLNDAIRAANMLSQAAAEESELSYLAETLYLRGEHWEALIAFYKQRSNQAETPEDCAHWMIQAGIIAETRLNQVEQAEELYALAREKSTVATIGITDVLRLRIRSGDWQEVIDIISEQASNAIDPAGMYFMAANVSHCLLQSEETTLENLKKCLEYAPSHVAALLLFRRITTGTERLWANQELLQHLSHRTICGWLQWENSNHAEFKFSSTSFEHDSVFFLERLFVLLLSDFEFSKESLLGMHPLVNTLLLTKATEEEAKKIASRIEDPTVGMFLYAESMGSSEWAGELAGRLSDTSVMVKELKAQQFERAQDFSRAEQVLMEIFDDESLPLDTRVKAALSLDRVLRGLRGRHLTLAKVHSTLASWLDDESPVNHFALLAAQLFSSVGNVSEATDFYKLRFQKKPVLGKVFNGLKILFLQTHNVSEMQSLLSELDELVLLDFAEIMEEFREYGKAADTYAKLLDISLTQNLPNEQMLPYYARMERCYEKSGNWSSVLSSLEKQRELVTSMEFQHYLDSKIQWVLVEHLADSDLALETYQRMLSNDPDNRMVLKALAKISIQHDQVSESIQYLNTLAENPTDSKDAIQIMNTLVEAHQAQGSVDKEIEVLKDIIDIDSGNVDAIDQLADCLQQQGEWQELFSLLQRRSVLSEDHDKVACHTRIARIAEERLLDVELALKEWSKVYEILGPEEETLRRLIHLSKSQFDTASFLHYADELVGLLEGEAKAELCMEIADAYINELLEEGKAVPYLEVALLEDVTFERAVEYLENQYQIMSEWQKLLDLLLHKESKTEGVAEKVVILLKAAEIAEISLQNQEQSDEIFSHIARLNPSNPEALRRNANALYANEEWDELLRLYTEHGPVFQENPRATVDMLIRQAEAAEKTEQWELVVSSLESVLAIVPTHLNSLQMMSASLLRLDRISEAVQIDIQLLEVLTSQGTKEDLAHVCIRLGESSLHLKEWAKALKFFQKSRIYSPNDSKSLKGIIECSWQKAEYSRVAQLCSTLVKNATSEGDVILGYLWRGFTLDAKLQRQELAEQHYWRVLEYDQNHPITLLYVSGISMRKSKWKSMFGQLTQAWDALSVLDVASVDSTVEETIALGRYIAAQKIENTEVESTMQSWLENKGVEISDSLDARFLERLTHRMFGL